uniref:LysR family transcriptional regulator n=1 Tax=Thaumasiovibrio occultus TaxID=1891184 RepID=UPI000B35FB99|nr:LysR family transcriptional regulator [Thaumasiovibrio occultus]
MKPYPNLPYSHNGLKVFEAVARKLSFTLAADELNVTQSAVSRQIRALEDELKTPLFERHHRHILLTAEGQALYAALSKHFEALDSMISAWQPRDSQRIVIKAALSYATRNLIPKMQHLNDKYPELEIVVVPTLDEDAGLHKSDYDILIFNTRKAVQDPSVSLLRPEYVAPVYASGSQKLELNDVLTQTRIHPTLDRIDWQSWLEYVGHRDTAPVRHLTYFYLDLALSACLSGQGATVTDLLLVLPELQQNFLHCPTGVSIQQGTWKYYYHQKQKSPLLDDITQWLIEETKAEMSALALLAEEHGWEMGQCKCKC